MFAFHKPKVYRSTQGCCICKAKSSSSRFTDSARYEFDFIECFQLVQPRKGEICNACVLLVKRFKRLPPGKKRSWAHVVDARVGPGLKSMTKFKKRKEEQLQLQQQQQQQNGNNPINTNKTDNISTEVNVNSNSNGGAGILTNMTSRWSSLSERFGKILKKPKKKIVPDSCSVVPNNAGSSDENSSVPSPISAHSDNDHEIKTQNNNKLVSYNIKKGRRKGLNPQKNRSSIRFEEKYNLANILDSSHWNKTETCCVTIIEHKSINSLIFNSKECSYHANNDKDSLRKYIDAQKLSSTKTNAPMDGLAHQSNEKTTPTENSRLQYNNNSNNDEHNDNNNNTSMKESSASHVPSISSLLSTIKNQAMDYHSVLTNNSDNLFLNKKTDLILSTNKNTTNDMTIDKNNVTLSGNMHLKRKYKLLDMNNKNSKISDENITTSALPILITSVNMTEKDPSLINTHTKTKTNTCLIKSPNDATSPTKQYSHKINNCAKIVNISTDSIIQPKKLETEDHKKSGVYLFSSPVKEFQEKKKPENIKLIQNIDKNYAIDGNIKVIEVNGNNNKFSDNSSDSGYEEGILLNTKITDAQSVPMGIDLKH